MKAKKILSLLVALAMVFSCVGVTAFADDSSATAYAKIDATTYDTFDDAVKAANAMTGDVTIEIYGALTTGGVNLTGGFTTLNFVGKDSTAAICVDGVGYINSRDISAAINFTGLKLSKINGSYAIDGNLNLYFSTYAAGNVTYTTCEFPTGVCAMGAGEGKTVTFDKCTFNNSNESTYSLWVDGNGTNCVVKDSTFSGYRGAKMYAEIGSALSSLTVTGTTFSDTIKKYGAVNLTKGASVVLTGNTYSYDTTTLAIVHIGDDYPETLADTTVTIEGTSYTVDTENEALEAVAAVAQIGETKYTDLQEALNAAALMSGEVTVEILDNVDLTDVDWTPVSVSEPGYPMVTVNGNEKTITGLNDMLFSGTWAGNSGLVINDLTIKDSKIENDVDDTKGTVGVGAFIGYPQASATITLNNCHLVDSTVSGGHWTGGLIGMAGGYSGNDGPVFMNLTIKDCSVTGSTITGKGSVGGVIGHAACSAWTNVVIEDTTVTNNTITSTGDATNKAGIVMGTIGAAGTAATADGVTKTGGVEVAVTESGNTATSNGTTITTVYGRQGSETGVLTITGGTYANNPIEEDVAYAAPAEGYEIVENADGTYSAGTMPNATVKSLGAMTIDEYTIYNGSWVAGTDPIDVQIAMEFIANDTVEEAAKNVFGNYTTDFFITMNGMSGESFVADGCYLVGNYGTYGWVMIPLDGMTIENGVVNNVITKLGLDFKYVNICSDVQNFKCGIYLSEDVIAANPDLEVTLTLGLSENLEAAQAAEFITVDEPYTYKVADFAKGSLKTKIYGVKNMATMMDENNIERYRIVLIAGLDDGEYTDYGFELDFVDWPTDLPANKISLFSHGTFQTAKVPTESGSATTVKVSDFDLDGYAGYNTRLFGGRIALDKAFDDFTMTMRPYAVLNGKTIYGETKTFGDIYTKDTTETNEEASE